MCNTMERKRNVLKLSKLLNNYWIHISPQEGNVKCLRKDSENAERKLPSGSFRHSREREAATGGGGGSSTRREGSSSEADEAVHL